MMAMQQKMKSIQYQDLDLKFYKKTIDWIKNIDAKHLHFYKV